MMEGKAPADSTGSERHPMLSSSGGSGEAGVCHRRVSAALNEKQACGTTHDPKSSLSQKIVFES